MALNNNPIFATASWVNTMRRNKLIAALFLLVQGIMFVAKPGTDMTGTAKWVAILIIVAAAISVICYFLSKKKTFLDTCVMIVCLILIVMGIVALIYREYFAIALRYIIGIFVVLGGVSSVIEAVKLEKKKKTWQFALSLAVAILLIGLGVGILVAESAVSTVMKRYIGIVLIINALVNLWNIYRMYQSPETK